MPQAEAGQVHFLHVTPSFAPGGAQVRTVQIINHLGPRFRHSIVSLDSDFSAAEAIGPAIHIQLLGCHSSRNPVTMTQRIFRLLRDEKPDLVLTYNWGSIDAVTAAAIAGKTPLIHIEDGFGDDEAGGQKLRRVLCRRLLLRRAHSVVAPSRTLFEMMAHVWKLPRVKLTHIPNGIDVEQFTPAASGSGGDLVIGTVCHLRREKRIDILLEAFAALQVREPARLVIAGDGPERPALEEKARGLGVEKRVSFLGRRKNPAEIYRRMRLFAISSSTEQMPLSVLEAMACGLPIAGIDVGDVKEMVSDSNKPFIAASRGQFPAALAALAGDARLAAGIGASNRARCVNLYDRRQMLARYGTLFERAMQCD
jgi:glycosyltransferase involved in cell wall biosynthesis